MIAVLVRKLLRDLWLPLVVVCVLLLAFQCLWARVTQRIATELLPDLENYVLQKQKQSPVGAILPALSPEQKERVKQQIADELLEMAFRGPGKLVQSLVGGESIQLTRVQDMLTVGFVHPLVQVMLCIWAIGRAAGAVAGEIDRGTMELLLAQPLPRWKLIVAHLVVDGLTIPLLCLSMWAGVWLGSWLMGLTAQTDPLLKADPWAFGPGLFGTALLVFAVGGYTMLISSLGRSRLRVLGLAILITLLQFLVNLFAQIWEPIEFLRPWMVFYYYQPQQIILDPHWMSDGLVWWRFLVLFCVGVVGYAGALVVFSRRDLPAPL